MDVKSNISRDYEKKSNWTLGESKPNQSQFQDPANGPEERENISLLSMVQDRVTLLYNRSWRKYAYFALRAYPNNPAQRNVIMAQTR